MARALSRTQPSDGLAGRRRGAPSACTDVPGARFCLIEFIVSSGLTSYGVAANGGVPLAPSSYSRPSRRGEEQAETGVRRGWRRGWRQGRKSEVWRKDGGEGEFKSSQFMGSNATRGALSIIPRLGTRRRDRCPGDRCLLAELERPATGI